MIDKTPQQIYAWQRLTWWRMKTAMLGTDKGVRRNAHDYFADGPSPAVGGQTGTALQAGVNTLSGRDETTSPDS